MLLLQIRAQPRRFLLCDTQTAECSNVGGSLGFGSGCCFSRHKPRWMNMSVCSEALLFQDLRRRVWGEITENDLCTCLLSTPLHNFNYLPQYRSSLLRFVVLPPEEGVALFQIWLCRSESTTQNTTRVLKLSNNIAYLHRRRKVSLKNDLLSYVLSQEHCHKWLVSKTASVNMHINND